MRQIGLANSNNHPVQTLIYIGGDFLIVHDDLFIILKHKFPQTK